MRCAAGGSVLPRTQAPLSRGRGLATTRCQLVPHLCIHLLSQVIVWEVLDRREDRVAPVQIIIARNQNSCSVSFWLVSLTRNIFEHPPTSPGLTGFHRSQRALWSFLAVCGNNAETSCVEKEPGRITWYARPNESLARFHKQH